MTDDITFCGSDCDNTNCRRHRSNIQEPQYPHSVALLEGTEYCEKKPTSKSVRLIDANALKYKNLAEVNGRLTYVLTAEEIDNAPKVKININDIEYKAYCKGLEDGKKIARPVDEEIETYKNAYRIMSDAFENEVRKNERPHGEWIEVTQRVSDSETFTYWECSICREPDRKDGRSKFCCECGADMQKGDAEK